MKKTLRVLSILALVAILFASCENNAEAPTAKNYLFGNSIVSTVGFTTETIDAEGNAMEEGPPPAGFDYTFLNYSFDENGTISVNEEGYEISDFKGTVDGMSYKVSFTTKVSAEEYEIKSELIFTVLDENTVKITGYSKAEVEGVVRTGTYNGTAPIFKAAPKWVVENDYFADSQGSSMILSLTKKSLIDFFTIVADISHHEMVPVEASLSSKSSDDSYEMTIQRVNRYGGKVVKTTSGYLIKKNAEGEIELVGKSIHRDETEDGLSYEERMLIIPITNIKLVKALPEWAEDIVGLVDKENEEPVLPVSSNALSLYYEGGNMLDFDRAEENGSLKYTAKIESINGVLYEEYVIEKSETEGEYNYTYTIYQLNEDGSKTVLEDVEGVGIPQADMGFGLILPT